MRSDPQSPDRPAPRRHWSTRRSPAAGARRREGRRSAVASGRAGMPATTTSPAKPAAAESQRACRSPSVSHEPAAPSRARESSGEPGAGRSRSSSGACRTHQGERRQDGDLGRELGRLWGDQKRREEPDAHGVHDTGHATLRDRHRVGDHEEEEDQDLGRRDEQPPERPTGDRSQVPSSRHRVAARREHSDPGRKREPEASGDDQEAES